MSNFVRISCLIAVACAPTVGQDCGCDGSPTTAYGAPAYGPAPFGTYAASPQAYFRPAPVFSGPRWFGNRTLMPRPSARAFAPVPRFAQRVASVFRPRRPILRRPVVAPRFRRPQWRPQRFMPSYAVGYSTMPMVSAGPVATIPVAATQLASLPVQYNCCTPCYEDRAVERTVMVPKLVEETRTVKDVKYVSVPREREVTVYERRPIERTVQEKRTAWVPRERTRKENYTVLKPVVETRRREVIVQVPEKVTKTAYRTEYRPEYRDVVREYTEMVPQRVRKTGTRRVATAVPVTRMQTVTQQSGHWETQQVAVNRPLTSTVAATTMSATSAMGGGCCTCVPVTCGVQTDYLTRQVFVPETVQVQQPCTTMQQATIEQPYEYDVVNHVPTKRQRTVRETRMRTVKVPYEYTEVVYRDKKELRTEKVERMVEEKRQRTIRFTEMVPQEQVRDVRVTEYRDVPVKKTETYTALVPREVERQVKVQVYRDTPTKVTERVRVPINGSVIR